jgi:fibronectin-binding autotransporter adhesin
MTNQPPTNNIMKKQNINQPIRHHLQPLALAVTAVLGLASSASAQSHNWLSTAPDLSWSNPLNWSAGTVPGPGNTLRFELGVADAAKGTIIMDKDYSASSISYVRFTGNEVVSIQSYLKTTSTVEALQLANGSGGAANVSVPAGGTIDSYVRLANETGRTAPVLNFTGGNWVAGNITTENSSRQGGIIRVSSPSGTLTPGVALISQTPQALATNRPAFNFVLTGAGATAVAPITFTAADPLQFTGGAAGTNPFTLTVDASAYSGPTVDIPLIVLNNADTARMFGGNITISGAPAGKGAFVTQTDTGSTLTLAGAGDWSGGASPITSWADVGNWAGGTAPGGGAMPIANLPAGVANVAVTLDGTSPTLAALNINSGAATASAYSIGQGTSGTINLGATPTGSVVAGAQINVLKGTSNIISAPVALTMDAQVNTAASTSLAMSGPISGAFSLTKGGDGTLALSGGANSYSGATVIEGGVLEVKNLANAGSNSDLGAYATPGAAGIVLKGTTLKYTGSSMTTAIDRGITLAANSTVNLPITGDMRLGSLALASAAAFQLNVTGSGAGTSMLYIDSVTVPNSTANRQGPVFNPSTANLTIGSITGNGNFQLHGTNGSTNSLIKGPINLGRGHFDQGSNGDQGQILGPFIANTVWTIESENTFDGRWYSAGGTLKIKSPGTLVVSQNVSYAFGRAADTVNWAGLDDKTCKYYLGGNGTEVQLLNDSSTSYEYKPGSRVSVRTAAGVKFTVGPQGAATNQTHKMGNMWIHDNNTTVTVNAIGASGYGLTFDDVRFRDGGAGYNMTILNNTTLTLASAIKTAGGNTLTAKFDGSGTTTVTGAVSQTTGTFNITQQGAGTLILNGGGNYSGATSVTGGKLFVNGDQTAATGTVTVSGGKTLGGTGTIGGNVTIADTARLEFNLTTPAGSHDYLALEATKTMTFSGSSVLDITGGGTAASGAYTLVYAPGGITGSVPATVNLPAGWTFGSLLLTESNTKLVLTITVPGGDPYATWAGAGVNAFDADANNDGVDNGMAWVLGATDKDANATSLLPTLDNTNATYFIFTYNRKDDANTDPNTTIKAQYCSDLATWTDAVHDGTNIIIAPTDNGAIDSVQVKIIRTLAVGGKLFARLNVQKAP